MSIVSFAPAPYGRKGQGLPPARAVNVLWEPYTGTPTKGVQLGRGGLATAYTVGVGPGVGGFQADGLFNGDQFRVSGAELYRGAVLLGAVELGSQATFAALKPSTGDQLVICSGGLAYYYDGATLAAITIPGDRYVVCVRSIGFRVVFICQDGRFYWSDAGAGNTIDSLSFATASSSPDQNVNAEVVGDELLIQGTTSTEVWSLTTSADAPFARGLGRAWTRGALAGSTQTFDNGIAFVGEDRIVYRSGAVPIRISASQIEVLLRRCETIGDLTTWRCVLEGHALYGVNIPGEGTWVYDASTQLWAEWSSYGRDTFRGLSCIQVAGVNYFGDDASGRVFSLDPATFTDAGEPIEYVVSASLIAERNQRIGSVELVGSRGNGEPGTEAFVDWRYSRDQGRSWTGWRTLSVGEYGAYQVRPRAHALGLMKPPGMLFEFRATSPAFTAFSHLLVS